MCRGRRERPTAADSQIADVDDDDGDASMAPFRPPSYSEQLIDRELVQREREKATDADEERRSTSVIRSEGR
jgi:hypothetical protein